MNEYRVFDFASLRNSHLKNGFWGRRTENYMEIIESQLSALLCETNSARLLNFGIASGAIQGEFAGANWSDGDSYKFLEACLYVYQNTGDQRVKEIVDRYIPWIVGSQEPDGYLNTQITLTNKGRWTNIMHHELYNIGHFLTLAAAHYDITGETVLLDAAKRLADYTYGVFEGYPPDKAHFGFNPSQIMGLCDLYRVTGEEKYYRLAEIFVNMRGSGKLDSSNQSVQKEEKGKCGSFTGVANGTDQNQDRVPLREETQAVGHAVTSTYLYSGAADVYAQTGEQTLLEALERIYTDMTTKRTYITGASSPAFVGYSDRGDPTHEAHGTQYDLPNKIAYNESCANIGNAMWAMRMLAITGDTKYGDFAERVMYNSGISGSNLALTRYFYSNPLSYRKESPIFANAPVQYIHKSSVRWHTFECWCCPPQLFRTMAGMGRWVYGQSDDTLFVNFYTDCDYSSDSLNLEMRSNYPWEETVTILVKKAENQKMKIRIPAWCKAPKVNGERVEAGWYATTVNTGDKIQLELPMTPIFMQANPWIEADRGMVAVMRGPVVYCAEGLDNTDALDELYMDPKGGAITEQFEPELLGGVITLNVPAKYRQQRHDTLYYELQTDERAASIKMIPYYTWANREESDMSVWFPMA